MSKIAKILEFATKSLARYHQKHPENLRLEAAFCNYLQLATAEIDQSFSIDNPINSTCQSYYSQLQKATKDNINNVSHHVFIDLIRFQNYQQLMSTRSFFTNCFNLSEPSAEEKEQAEKVFLNFIEQSLTEFEKSNKKIIEIFPTKKFNLPYTAVKNQSDLTKPAAKLIVDIALSKFYQNAAHQLLSPYVFKSWEKQNISYIQSLEGVKNSVAEVAAPFLAVEENSLEKLSTLFDKNLRQACEEALEFTKPFVEEIARGSATTPTPSTSPSKSPEPKNVSKQASEDPQQEK